MHYTISIVNEILKIIGDISDFVRIKGWCNFISDLWIE